MIVQEGYTAYPDAYNYNHGEPFITLPSVDYYGYSDSVIMVLHDTQRNREVDGEYALFKWSIGESLRKFAGEMQNNRSLYRSGFFVIRDGVISLFAVGGFEPVGYTTCKLIDFFTNAAQSGFLEGGVHHELLTDQDQTEKRKGCASGEAASK